MTGVQTCALPIFHVFSLRVEGEIKKGGMQIDGRGDVGRTGTGGGVQMGTGSQRKVKERVGQQR